MKTYSLHFKRVGDERPPDGIEVWFIKVEKFYGSHVIRYATVEWSWSEVDENGRHTGSGICYDKRDDRDNPPDHHVLEVCFDGYPTDNDTLWAPVDAVWALVDELEEK